uniref:DNA-directed RNA polymerase subunit beta n=1 Tax=Trichuris muris TaxID=70415 RepID=A0A5S6QQ32_TRIMR
MDCNIAAPHLNSFNNFLDGIPKAVSCIRPRVIQISEGLRCELQILNPVVSYPGISKDSNLVEMVKLLPYECRCRGITYKSKLSCTFRVLLNGTVVQSSVRPLVDVPIMVRSRRCYLEKVTSEQLVTLKEEAKEFGGYFIVNGVEKIIRLLITTRRNYPIAINRPKWATLGAHYTPYGIYLRCVLDDHTAVVSTIHYLSSRRMTFCVYHKRRRFLLPFVVLLKALVEASDRFIFDELLQGIPEDNSWKGCVTNMLMDLRAEGISSQTDALQHIGEMLRVELQAPAFLSNAEIGQQFVDDVICIHLEKGEEKFNFLVFCAQKLYAFVKGEVLPESLDNPAYQEILLPGTIMLMLLKERIEAMLDRMVKIITDIENVDEKFFLDTKSRNMLAKAETICVRCLEYLLCTGNLPSSTQLFLSQTTGYSIIAERLNYLRFVSHFRGIHRGAFFTEMRSSDVRKLQAEAWGFICPVHTPDGAPCGLLNHLAASCEATTDPKCTQAVVDFLLDFGLLDIYQCRLNNVKIGSDCYRVLVDGDVTGYVQEAVAKDLVDNLRAKKLAKDKMFRFVEICFVSNNYRQSLYPAIYIFTDTSRMMRPVFNLHAKHPNNLEMIGTYEQALLDICIKAEEYIEGVTTHQELLPTAFLSYNANLIPFADHNQSPRNVYQCQMAKQTMGTPSLTIPYRTDGKLYRLLTPQSPLVRTVAYDKYEVDDYPLGTNAIVAVISHTGYDMEDAMVINKSSIERGFASGVIYKSMRINLSDRSFDGKDLMFHRDPKDERLPSFLDWDGLPYISRLCNEGEPLVCFFEPSTSKYTVKSYRSSEPGYVDNIKVVGSNDGLQCLKHVCITFRLQRNPIVGDKFASRHGQKGINSFLWPSENMPYTESGIVADIIFNPHGFPSRMTVGMMIESMAGKAASLGGTKLDSTPFKYSERNPAVKHFGDLLTKAGYNYYGNERMYSGIDGRSFLVDIFFGVVYYQRLRHMVSDKFQVRATGGIDPVTKQPLQGRKKGGGIRFGEMERDSMISHGTSFLLQDRLFNCSDKDYAYLCKRCGSLITIAHRKADQQTRSSVMQNDSMKNRFCATCKTGDHLRMLTIPAVLRYLIAELSSVNIGMRFQLA